MRTFDRIALTAFYRYFLIVFGCSCLLRLGWDLLTFNDYKQAVPLLEQDIRCVKRHNHNYAKRHCDLLMLVFRAARSDLQRRGFKLTA